jgi:hypothetical protein
MMMDIDNETPSPSPTPSYLESILGLKLPLTSSSFSTPSTLVSLLSEIKPKDKRKLDQLHTLISQLKDYSSNDAYKESKELAYAKVVKRDNTSLLYHTAEKDEISPTMAAFYFRDKSKANLSDKEAAAMKAIHYEPSYEMNIDNAITSNKKNSNISNISNNNINNDDDLSMCSNSNNNDMKLKKKRKGSFNAYNYNGSSSNGANMHSNTKSVTKKKRTSNNGNNNNNNNNNASSSGGEKEYCIPNCLLGRNDGSPQMVACDKCNSWFHWKCVGFEEEKKSQAQWYCMDCTNKINELNNNNN